MQYSNAGLLHFDLGRRLTASSRGSIDPEMAVLIQPMLEPRCAGVMFTINPLTGSWREMTVEAAWGQAAPVVNGEVVPDAYLVRRPRRVTRQVERLLARAHLEVVGDEVRSQSEMWVRGEGSLRRVPVPAAMVDAPKLQHNALARLCRLGLRVESLMGGPQDIEWAMTPDKGLCCSAGSARHHGAYCTAGGSRALDSPLHR